mmetsp:Transcript_21397/g.62517  ORF Transcript_21397/g.62517 Transcript_21397/m.62517 type:complete len:273 (-) Transcript_21397:8161-8979(-)
MPAVLTAAPPAPAESAAACPSSSSFPPPPPPDSPSSTMAQNISCRARLCLARRSAPQSVNRFRRLTIVPNTAPATLPAISSATINATSPSHLPFRTSRAMRHSRIGPRRCPSIRSSDSALEKDEESSSYCSSSVKYWARRTQRWRCARAGATVKSTVPHHSATTFWTWSLRRRAYAPEWERSSSCANLIMDAEEEEEDEAEEGTPPFPRGGEGSTATTMTRRGRRSTCRSFVRSRRRPGGPSSSSTRRTEEEEGACRRPRRGAARTPPPSRN